MAENNRGHQVYYKRENDLRAKQDDGLMISNPSFLHSKWRILPKYVTFEEAMIAMKDDYTVRCFPGTFDGDSFIEFNKDDSLRAVADSWHGLSFGDLANGKWKIIE